jgi:hypothetical protein
MDTAIIALVGILLTLLYSLSFFFLGLLLGWRKRKHGMHATEKERIAVSQADVLLICTMICLKYDIRRDGKKILPTELDQYIHTVTESQA